jgi:mono/diheme cytochrome c family protein
MDRARLICVAAFAIALSTQASAQDPAYGRRLYFEKASCDYCHGWAGDGSGQGQSPGGAANLRQSHLGRDQLVMIISCGVPGTPMPHFD